MTPQAPLICPLRRHGVTLGQSPSAASRLSPRINRFGENALDGTIRCCSRRTIIRGQVGGRKRRAPESFAAGLFARDARWSNDGNTQYLMVWTQRAAYLISSSTVASGPGATVTNPKRLPIAAPIDELPA